MSKITVTEDEIILDGFVFGQMIEVRGNKNQTVKMVNCKLGPVEQDLGYHPYRPPRGIHPEWDVPFPIRDAKIRGEA